MLASNGILLVLYSGISLHTLKLLPESSPAIPHIEFSRVSKPKSRDPTVRIRPIIMGTSKLWLVVGNAVSAFLIANVLVAIWSWVVHLILLGCSHAIGVRVRSGRFCVYP